MDKFIKSKWALIAILLLATILRLAWLSFGDATTDEVLYAFRAVDMLDFDESGDQSTPLVWFDPMTIERRCSGNAINSEELGVADLPESLTNRICQLDLGGEIPSWTNLSFHDHPPLVFFVQNISMKIFGESPFGFRLPSALFGIASVYLMYLIVTILYSRDAGLFSALIYAVATNAVYISRAGLQEAQLIFFILFAVLLFLRAQKDERFYIYAGIAIGFGLLTKYLAFVLVPIFLVYLIVHNRLVFTKLLFWYGVAASVVVISPVLIYNYFLYSYVGHFDFQLSFIFRQLPEVWTIAPGKDIGSLAERFYGFIPTLFKVNSWLFLLVAFVALLSTVWDVIRNKSISMRKHSFLLLSSLFFLLLIAGIGNGFRFLSLLTLPLVIFIGIAMKDYYSRFPKVFLTFLVPIIIFELFFLYSSQFNYSLASGESWLYTKDLRFEKHDGGYNELANYLDEELRGRAPEQIFEMQYTFLNDLHQEAVNKAAAKQLDSYSAVIIYDDDLDHIAQLWYLDRLNIYHAWPTLSTRQYLKFLEVNNIGEINGAGFDNYYVIIPTSNVYTRKQESQTSYGEAFEAVLNDMGVKPRKILGAGEKEAFRVYKF